jgi:hypothetical protein
LRRAVALARAGGSVVKSFLTRSRYVKPAWVVAHVHALSVGAHRLPINKPTSHEQSHSGGSCQQLSGAHRSGMALAAGPAARF